ncbi:MAG: hypothetical protein WC654_05110 [Patescibacteria group bacterium]
MALREWGTRLDLDEPKPLRSPHRMRETAPRAPRADHHPRDVGGRIFRAGLWFVLYPHSSNMLPQLRRWRDNHQSNKCQPTFQGQELPGAGLFERVRFAGLNQRIERVRPSVLLVADAPDAVNHERASAFVEQLTPPLLAITAILIFEESSRANWPQTSPPRIITLEELDTLIA